MIMTMTLIMQSKCGGVTMTTCVLELNECVYERYNENVMFHMTRGFVKESNTVVEDRM